MAKRKRPAKKKRNKHEADRPISTDTADLDGDHGADHMSEAHAESIVGNVVNWQTEAGRPLLTVDKGKRSGVQPDMEATFRKQGVETTCDVGTVGSRETEVKLPMKKADLKDAWGGAGATVTFSAMDEGREF